MRLYSLSLSIQFISVRYRYDGAVFQHSNKSTDCIDTIGIVTNASFSISELRRLALDMFVLAPDKSIDGGIASRGLYFSRVGEGPCP